ncbi:hypothetical protein [Bacteroides thetaiotaomicron]|uniref:hypothetical protein n=1 Tax=Bacteroides thetaiotaomicron TaxID=818 RepID=UPI003569C38C
MEQIIVKHRDNTPLLLNSRANISGITKAEQKVGLLSDDLTEITVESATPLNFELGDTIDVFGKTYTLNFLPTIKKTGNRKFSYDLTFEGPQYELLDVQFLLPDDTTGDSFTGNLKDFLDVLLQNIRRIFPSKWALGEYPADTEYKTLSYVGENCLSVLQNLCKEHNIEFEIEQTNGVKTLHIRKAGVNFPYTFRYGKTGGLYELTRKNINSKNVVTRLYVYGGSSNLGSKYRYSKLCLPGKNKNASYIEDAAAIAAFGVKENTKTFDKIFPNRYGKVTGKGMKYYAFVDSTMNFDLNEKDSEGTKWLIEGVNAKVKFTTGNLAGYEFDVHKYDHATKTIELVPFTDENGMKFPSETSAAFQFQAGDIYFFTDINLPDSYKTDAEKQLSTEGTEYYNQNCQPQAEYGLNIDQNFIKQFAGELTVVNLFAVGDYIPVEDTDIGVNKAIRITGFTRDLLKPYKYSLTLGDSVTQSSYTRIISDLKEIDKVIDINDLADPAKARRNWKASQEVLAMVFDPEGDYYTDKIKPGSIETLMLSVGAKSMQFMLQNTLIEANYQGNKNLVKVTGGVLTHYTIEENIRNWNLATATTTLTSDSTAYYIYAKCQKEGNAGSIILSTTQITVDHDPNYYHFWVGVINSVVDEVRAVSLTYGATTINGKFIRTGQIESSDGSCFINLDGNGFRLGDNISSLAWNNNKDRKLRLKGTLIQSPSGAESALGVFRGSYSSYSMYYSGDEVTYNGSMYRCIQNCPTAGIMPINTTYWQLVAQKGADGNLEGIIIGGRNYVLGSDRYITSGHTGFNFSSLNEWRNKYITVSVDIEVSNTSIDSGIENRIGFEPSIIYSDDTVQYIGTWYTISPNEPNFKGRISYTHKIQDKEIKELSQTGIYIQCNGTAKIGRPKLEFGNVATDWTAAPEDVQAEIEIQPVYVFCGNYSPYMGYTGSSQRVDIVKYNNIYYRAKRKLNGSFSNQTPADNSTYWENFGAQFESIATNLILAEGANIGDWVIQSGKIVSTLNSSNKISLDASGSKIEVDSSRSGGDYSENYGQGSKIKIDASNGIVEARSKSNTSRVAYMSPTGIFANNAETMAVSASLGITRKAAIVGLGYGNVSKSNWANENFIAGVYGTASNSGNAPAYGGFFQNLLAAGLFLKTRAIEESSSSVYLSESDSLVIGYSRNEQIVYLPNDGVIGRIIFFKQWWTGNMKIYARGGQLIYDDHTVNNYHKVYEGKMAVAIFTIGYVAGVKKEAWLINTISELIND